MKLTDDIISEKYGKYLRYKKRWILNKGDFDKVVDDYALGKLSTLDVIRIIEVSGSMNQYLRNADQMLSRIRNANSLHLQSAPKFRNHRTIYIVGQPGSGKTTLAHYIMTKIFNFDYVTASGLRDPFQNYGEQEGVIWDDFRDTSIDYVSLLNVLDPHYTNLADARYSNKGLAYCKCTIITSVQYPSHLYRDGTREDLDQLYRRMSHAFIEVREDDIVWHNIGVDGSILDTNPYPVKLENLEEFKNECIPIL